MGRNTVAKSCSVALIAFTLSLALVGGALAQDTEAPLPTGAISGRMYSADEEQTPQSFPILVVPSNTAQPIPLEDYGDPDLGHLTPPSRTGPGLVRPDVMRGEYSVNGLPPGEYLVAAYAPSAGGYEVDPPEEVQISLRGEISTERGFRVRLTEGSAAMMDFVFAGPRGPEGPSRLKLCADTYDRNTLASGPDRVLRVDIQPATPGIRVTVTEDGCAQLENVPPGTYTISLETSRGFSLTHTLDVGPGEDGQINLGTRPPAPGGLPATGSADAANSGISSLIAGLAGLAVFASGAVVLAALRRRGT